MKAFYDGLNYITDDDVFIWHINNGFSEPYPRELDIVKSYLELYPSCNNIFIDVGGHIGTTSLPYSRLYNKVIAFEPNKKSYDFFRKNIELNKIANVELHNKGVYNKTTKCSCIKHTGGNSGCFYIKEESDKEDSIDVIKLDDLNINDNVDFIKIDTEGSELLVLEGAIKLIQKYKPLIQVETNQCSAEYFDYDKSKIIDFMKHNDYKIFNDDGNNPLFYHKAPLLKCIYVFWTGDNPMNQNRINCLENLKKVSESEVVLITKENLKNYILESEPLHPAYKFLSETHRSDYLRTYFMNFYGGGYSDIKNTTYSWKDSFDKLINSDKWIIGYKEISGGVAYPLVSKFYEQLIGNGSYICKPKSPLTKEWYSEMINLLDEKLEKLRIYPSTNPQDCSELSNGKYPIGWNEMLGRIFHKICYKYKNRLLNTLPVCEFSNYR